MVLVLKTYQWYRFHRFYMSISPVLWHKFQRVFSTASCTSTNACWELWLSDDQPHSDYDGQWQMALYMMVVLQSSQPNPYRNKKQWKMYAIKQIKICAEYRDMLPRPRLDFSGIPGLRPIGLSPGPWQISLGLGSMSWYSVQILICITLIMVMAWRRQETSHYLSQCWPRSLSTYGATRAQWDKKCFLTQDFWILLWFVLIITL